MKLVSLFSGAGGLDWGFAAVGFKVVFANDVDAAAVSTYARNFGLRRASCNGRVAEAAPGVALACDVERVDFSPLRGEVDVLVGGPPCQDFSLARGPERRGVEAERGRLYLHFARALAVIQPRAFVFENVPGLVSANGGSAYRAVLASLQRPGAAAGVRAEGYATLFAGVVDFSQLGVPQRRERLLIVGVRRDVLRDAWEASQRVKAALGRGLFRKYPLTPLEAFEGRPLAELQDRYVEVMEEWRGVWEEVGTPRAWEWKREVWDRLTFDVAKDYALANGIRLAEEEFEEAMREHEEALRELGYYGYRVCSRPPPDGTCETPEEDPAVVERMRRIPPGENHVFVKGTRWETAGRVASYYQRLHPLKPSYTVVARAGGGTYGYHYEKGRSRLALRELARLQTFPDGFLFSGGKAEVRAQIGEAVPPLASKRLAEALAELLKE